MIAGLLRIPADTRLVCCPLGAESSSYSSLLGYTMLTAVPLRSEYRTSPAPVSILAYIPARGSPAAAIPRRSQNNAPDDILRGALARLPIPSLWSLGLEHFYLHHRLGRKPSRRNPPRPANLGTLLCSFSPVAHSTYNLSENPRQTH
jgi:hypothetical protein